MISWCLRKIFRGKRPIAKCWLTAVIGAELIWEGSTEIWGTAIALFLYAGYSPDEN